MKNDALSKAMRGRMMLAIVLSAMLVCGIPMIPVGFIYVMPVGIIGIIFTVCGFYGCPVAWTTFGSLASYRGVCSMIEEDGIYSVREIAATLGTNEKKVKQQVAYLVSKRFLRGYTFDGVDKITPVGAAATTGKTAEAALTGKCPNCGATLTEEDGKLHCRWCGGVFPLRK